MADELTSRGAAAAGIAEELLENAVTRAEGHLAAIKSSKVGRVRWREWWAHRRRVAEAKEQLVLANDQLEWHETREAGKWDYMWRRGTLPWGLLGFIGTVTIGELFSDPLRSLVVLAGGALLCGGAGTFALWIGWHNREEGHRNWLRSLETGKRAEVTEALPPNSACS